MCVRYSFLPLGPRPAEVLRELVLQRPLNPPEAPVRSFFGHQLAYPAQIRYRVLARRGVRYGLEFAGPDSLDYKRFQLVLTEYVMRRQREILQGKSG